MKCGLKILLLSRIRGEINRFFIIKQIKKALVSLLLCSIGFTTEQSTAGASSFVNSSRQSRYKWLKTFFVFENSLTGILAALVKDSYFLYKPSLYKGKHLDIWYILIRPNFVK